ncbi:MAG: MCP four helix bundle domain-containing protein [Defluviitaleaceae bacterium]|nr:MCP four helix bundle domain-containing protein [Defluviitaleaceae bacterium]
MKNMRVSKKLTVSFLSVITLTVIVGVVGVIGMTQINSGSKAMYESQSQALANLSSAREYFQRLRVQLRDVVLASGNIPELETIETYFNNYERLFISYMEAYKPTITDEDVMAL